VRSVACAAGARPTMRPTATATTPNFFESFILYLSDTSRGWDSRVVRPRKY